MAILILQIGDIHIHSQNDWILRQSEQIASAVFAEADAATERCIVLVAGDSVQTGAISEFELAATFLEQVRSRLIQRLRCDCDIITIPGNHDLSFKCDQAAREQIINGLSGIDVPAASVSEIILAPLQNYFDFASRVSLQPHALSRTSPFERTIQIPSNHGMLEVRTINTAWMSRLTDAPGTLFFPISEIADEVITTARYSISVLHHPFNWFHQPSTMRPLREAIESRSDLIITGHEHSNIAHTSRPIGTACLLQYLEGGVLQDRTQPAVSSFAVLSLDFNDNTQRIVRYSLKGGTHYLRELGAEATQLHANFTRRDRRFQISGEFREFLDNPDLPLADSNQRPIRLLDFFTYPDLRSQDEDEDRFIRTKGPDVFDHLSKRRRAIIGGGARSGKTSFAKAMFADLLGRGCVPVFIDGDQLSNRVTNETVRALIRNSLKQQYSSSTVEEFEQCSDRRKVAVIDNLNCARHAFPDIETLLQWCSERFDSLYAFVDEETAMEQFRLKMLTGKSLAEFELFTICEFGYVRIEQFATRWIAAARPGSNVTEEGVRKVCKTIGSVLQTNAIPHHPWVLIVLLQEMSISQKYAVRNGSYGHLFQALVTTALARSKVTATDIETKLVYLSEMAQYMYARDVVSLDDGEVRAFHIEHCEKYDLELSCDEIVSDLASVHIIRVECGCVAFRTRYAFSFFVARNVARNIQNAAGRAMLRRVAHGVYHNDTANIFLFLAHLTNDPQVIHTIISAARHQFADAPAVKMTVEFDELNILQREEFGVRLQNIDPEVMRLRIMEERDQRITARGGSETDARSIRQFPALDEEEVDEAQRIVRTIAASFRIIEILGQVVRNGAGSIDAEQKRALVEETYLLGRRMIGRFVCSVPTDLGVVCTLLWEKYEIRFPGEPTDVRIDRIMNWVAHFVWSTTYCVVKKVSEATAHDMLRRTFERVVAGDKCLANQLFDLSVKLDTGKGIPFNDAVRTHEGADGNFVVRAVIKALIVNFLLLNRVKVQDRQYLCDSLGIECDSSVFDPAEKMGITVTSGMRGKWRDGLRELRRKRKREARKRRGR